MSTFTKVLYSVCIERVYLIIIYYIYIHILLLLSAQLCIHWIDLDSFNVFELYTKHCIGLGLGLDQIRAQTNLIGTSLNKAITCSVFWVQYDLVVLTSHQYRQQIKTNTIPNITIKNDKFYDGSCCF